MKNQYYRRHTLATNIDFSSHFNWLLWYGLEFWWITYDSAMSLDPTIIIKWTRSSICHRSHWISDSNLPWKSLVIITSTFLFCSFLHDYRLLDSSIIVRSVGSSTSLNTLVVSLSQRWSLNQYMRNTIRFCCTLVTTNLPFARVLLAYIMHAAWISYASSLLRCPVPSGSINMSSWMPFLAVCMLMPNIISILSVFHSIGGDFIFLQMVSYWVW